MPYFAGPNVSVAFKMSEPTGATNEPIYIEECAGISYVLNNSQQPIYGYASLQFDAMLPGREIIQGNFLLNHTEANYLFSQLQGENKPTKVNSAAISYNGLLTDAFDIHIRYVDSMEGSHEIIIKYCYIFSKGQTIQISEQGIVDEYSFIGRTLMYNQS